jgi:hypothetical protein
LDITDINNFIYAAVTITSQTMNQPSKRRKTMDQPSKRRKNRQNEIFWKIIMQRQICNWRNEFSIMDENCNRL